jgi:methylated-DNA-[protein]-cysteine S-methyltransferase
VSDVVAYGSCDSALGELWVTTTAAGVLRVSWDAEGERPASGGSGADAVLAQALAELDAYAAGRRRAFEVAVDLRGVGGFRRRVLEELMHVPYGRVVTYAELAARAGRPRAARAVGRCMATNPVPVIVPCHRVLAAGHRIGGYSGGRGLDTKASLLLLEGALGAGSCP